MVIPRVTYLGRGVAIAALVLAIAGCGGGGGSATPAAPAGQTAVAVPTQAGTLSLTFGSQAAPSAARRGPAFVSPAAATVAIAINGGPATSFDVSPTSTLCTTTAGTRTCTLAFAAPVGPDSIAASLMSGGATPAILGQGSNSVTVVGGTPFALTIGVNPIVAAIANLVITYPSSGSGFSLGTAATAGAAITFADPGGATITGSGNVPNFLVPVTLTSSDPHITISPSSLTTPGQAVTVTYDGSVAIAGTVNLTAKVGTTTLATGAINTAGLFVTRYNISAITAPGTIIPGQIIAGPDGNVWWTEPAKGRIGRIAPGTVSTNPSVQSGITYFSVTGSPTGLAVGPDGNIWYSGGQIIGRMTPTGGVPATGPSTITVGAPGSQIGRLAPDSQGNVWYLNGGSSFSQVAYVDASFAVHTFGSTPTPSSIQYFGGLTLGGDKAMWFTEYHSASQQIGRITTPANGTAGTYTEFPVPNSGQLIYPTAIAKDPMGTVWFSEFASNAANQFYANFVPGPTISINEFPKAIDPAAFANLVTIFPGPDGNMWMAEGGGAVRINPATPGVAVVQFFTDNGQSSMIDCTTGPDANLWCSTYGSASLGPGFINTTDAILTWKPR